MLKTLCGNEGLKQSLSAALAAGRLSHCILLCGEAGTGAGYAARCLAADYLYPEGGPGAAQVMENASPEYLVLAGEGVSGEIKIDRVREVRRAVFSTAMSAQGRVVHIAGANKLNGASANALLKVLEEPPEGVLFLLTAPGEAAVLPTLRSRCSVYTLAPVSVAVCAEYLHTQFPAVPKKQTQELAALFGGKIGSARRCLGSVKSMRLLDDAKALAASCTAHDAYTALCTLSRYEKDRTEARSLLALLTELCGAALRGAYPALPAVLAAAALPCVAQADTALAANGSQKLMLTCLAAQLAALQ